jgi:hypothetical protein
MSAVGTGIVLDQAAQDVAALFLDGIEILTLGRQQFGVFHGMSPLMTCFTVRASFSG